MRHNTAMAESENLHSILVVRLGALGDVANTLPAVCALRREFPNVRIGWVVEESSRGLVAASRAADEIILFPRKEIRRLVTFPWTWHKAAGEISRFIRTIRQGRYDVMLDFQGNLKSGLMSVLSGIPDRVGFAAGHCREMNWLFNSVLAMPATKRMLRAEKAAALAQAVAPELALGAVELPVDAPAAARVEEFLKTLPGSGPLVVLHPGTSAFGHFKRWPAERFGAAAAELAGRRGARCVVTYGPSEKELAGQVVAASSGAAHLAPPLNVPELIELLRRADLMIACDTGPLHIAALLRRPLVALFGPKDPAIYAPFGARCEIVRVDGLSCSPCTRRRCRDPKCMEGITVEMVVAAGERMICE